MSNQPTATVFVRGQESWAQHLLTKLKEQINEREQELANLGVDVDDWADDDLLYDLEEDFIFYTRYAKEMAIQREYIRNKYLGG